MESASSKPTGRDPYSSQTTPSETESGNSSVEHKKEIPEPDTSTAASSRDLSRASHLIKPGLEGLKYLKSLSPEQLLPIVFDQKALNQWESYHSEEKRQRSKSG
ncbi:MAG: hypothetical protein ACR2PX_20735 [Endozoicomonas sp.]